MPRLKWDQVGERLFETGVDHCVLFPLNDEGEYKPGVAWNGITQITETPDGAEPNEQYADNIKYLVLMSAESLNGTIQAFMYPPEWGICDGSAEVTPGVYVGQQSRNTFGLYYRTKIGNDIAGQAHGNKHHFLYGAKASPSDRTYDTINDSPEPINFSWEFNTTPVQVTGYEPTSLITIDDTILSKETLDKILDIVLGSDAVGAAVEGTDTGVARLPMPDELIALIKGETSLAMQIRSNYRRVPETMKTR